MTPREQAAVAAGIEVARQMALTTAVTIEVRGDTSRVQHRAAVAALQALAEGARDPMMRDEGKPEPDLARLIGWFPDGLLSA